MAEKRIRALVVHIKEKLVPVWMRGRHLILFFLIHVHGSSLGVVIAAACALAMAESQVAMAESQGAGEARGVGPKRSTLASALQCLSHRPAEMAPHVAQKYKSDYSVPKMISKLSPLLSPFWVPFCTLFGSPLRLALQIALLRSALRYKELSKS